MQSFKKHIAETAELDEAYKATSEKSQFGGHRAHLKNPQGKTSYLGSASYAKPEHAKGEAQAYHDAYHNGSVKNNEVGANRAVQAYRAKHKEHMHVKEEVELDEAVDPSEIAGNPKAYNVDAVKKAYYHKKVSASDKESLGRHLDRYHGHKEWRKPLVKEDVEQIDEMTQGKSYTQDQLRKKMQSGNWEATHDIKPGKHVEMRHHTGKRVMVHVKEEVDLDEAAPKIKQDNIKAIRAADNAHDNAMGRTATGRKKPVRQMTSTQKSLASMRKEEVEQLDELSPNLLHRYVKKAAGNMGMHAVDHGKYGDEQKDKNSLNKAKKRLSGITSASGRMADKANKNEAFTPAEKAAYLAAANKKASLDYWKTHAELKKNDPRVSKPLKKESVEDLDESEINDLAAQYINENNITLDQLENMTEEELNELIGKAIGGAFKLGAKAAVGATRLAGKAVNRMSASGRADAAEKKADSMEKKNADRERIKAAQERLRKAKESARNK